MNHLIDADGDRLLSRRIYSAMKNFTNLLQKMMQDC